MQKIILKNFYESIEELFDGVRGIHFKSYLRYLYFNVGRIAYLQANVLSAYVFLAPAIVTGAITRCNATNYSSVWTCGTVCNTWNGSTILINECI